VPLTTTSPTSVVEPAGAGASERLEPSAAVIAVSVANGPTATSVRPVRLSRRTGARYTLQIEGANLHGATAVTLVGVETYVSLDPPVVSANGRRVSVDVVLAPDTPLGAVPIVVSGDGWSTRDGAAMRVEITP
jgi:hypothetical protein